MEPRTVVTLECGDRFDSTDLDTAVRLALHAKVMCPRCRATFRITALEWS